MIHMKSNVIPCALIHAGFTLQRYQFNVHAHVRIITG